MGEDLAIAVPDDGVPARQRGVVTDSCKRPGQRRQPVPCASDGGAERAGQALGALLKALGVTRGGVAGLFAVEFGLLGLVAGLFGGLGALVLSWVFLAIGLDLDGIPHLWSVPLAALGTAMLAILAGLATSRRALASRPLASLGR